MAEIELEHELCCGICLELFEKPLMLPCQHNFCTECIKSLIKTGCSEEKDHNTKFKCPFCSTDFNFLSMKDLSVNFTLSNIVEKYKLSKHTRKLKTMVLADSDCVKETKDVEVESDHRDIQFCSFCENSGSNSQAVKICINCDLTVYCLECLAIYHPNKGAFAKHNVVDICSAEARKELGRRETVCVSHRKPVMMLCMNCDILMCNACLVEGLHVSHDVKDISEGYDICKKWLTRRGGHLSEYFKVLDESKIKKLAHAANFKIKVCKVMSVLNDQFKRLHNALVEKQKELFQELAFRETLVKENFEADVVSIDRKLSGLGELSADTDGMMERDEFRFLKDFKELKSRLLKFEVDRKECDQECNATNFDNVHMNIKNCQKSIETLELDWTQIPDVYNISLTSKKQGTCSSSFMSGRRKYQRPSEALTKKTSAVYQPWDEPKPAPSQVSLGSSDSSNMAEDSICYVHKNITTKKIPEPNPGVQVRDIKASLEHPLNPGDSWNLIAMAWFTKWKKYVNFDFGHIGLHNLPGPIDNGPLFEEGGENLKKGLTEGLDYVLLKHEGWEQMVSWYGVVKGQREIRRVVEQEGLSYCSQNFKVKIYEITLTFKMGCASFEKSFSYSDQIQTLIDTAKNEFVKSSRNIRLRDDKGSLLLSMKLTVSDYDLKSGSTLLVEEC